MRVFSFFGDFGFVRASGLSGDACGNVFICLQSLLIVNEV